MQFLQLSRLLDGNQCGSDREGLSTNIDDSRKPGGNFFHLKASRGVGGGLLEGKQD